MGGANEERNHWILKSYIFFTTGGDVDSRGGGPPTKPDLYSERSHLVPKRSNSLIQEVTKANSAVDRPQIRICIRRGIIWFRNERFFTTRGDENSFRGGPAAVGAAAK